MGVSGLWTLLDAASQTFTLQELAIIEGFQRHSNKHAFRVGVDTDALMAQCIAGAQSTGVHGPGPLRVLFFKLCTFLKSPITWIFVFDGPSRPNIKRGRKVRSLAPSWRGPAQSLIKAFGFVVQEAPGEGEAELAKLNEFGIIDAVLTTDSDAFVFGAKCVIRSVTLSDRKKLRLHSDEINIYAADAIEHTEGILLSPGGFIVVALSLGGDYSNGIEGCGLSTAHSLAKCGFGDTLLKAARTLSDEHFEQFRRKWLDELKHELKTNSKGHLTARQPKLVSKIADTFPERDILDLYVNPLTSFSPSQIPPDFENWTSVEPPQISRVAEFCHNNLGWRDVSDLLKTFQNSLWEGIFLQLLYTQDVRYDREEHVLHNSLLHVEVVKSVEKVHQVQRTLHLNPWSRVTFSLKTLIAEVGKVIPNLPEYSVISKQGRCTVWVPMCILPNAMLLPKNQRDETYRASNNKPEPRNSTIERSATQKRRRPETPTTPSSPEIEAMATHLQQHEVVDVYPSPLLPDAVKQPRQKRSRGPSTLNADVIDVYPDQSHPKARSSQIQTLEEVLDLTASPPPNRLTLTQPFQLGLLQDPAPTPSGSQEKQRLRLIDALDLLDRTAKLADIKQQQEITQGAPSTESVASRIVRRQRLTRSCSDGSYLGKAIEDPIIISSDSE